MTSERKFIANYINIYITYNIYITFVTDGEIQDKFIRFLNIYLTGLTMIKGGEECGTYLTPVCRCPRRTSTADESHSVG